MLVEAIYRPLPIDIVGNLSQRRIVASASLSAALTNVSVQLVPSVPANEVWFITGWYFELTPGAAQAVQDCNANVTDGTSFFRVFGHTWEPAAINVRTLRISGHCELLMFPTEALLANGFFSAGAAANSLIATAHGYAIPRGNVQR